jgi:hypothetical protein
MQGNVSDRYAIELHAHFFRRLAAAPDRDRPRPWRAAHRAAERERQPALGRGIVVAPE